MTGILVRASIAAMLAAASASCLAIEGGVGRSFVGAQITPYIGIIPPEPGFEFSFDYIRVDGNIGGSREVPIAGELALNLDATFNLYATSIAYIWDTGPGHWNFASVALVPFDQVDASADLTVGNSTFREKDSDSGLFDMTFVPVVASYHVSEVEHWALAMYISAPTGSYTKGQLANNSLNNWTFAPSVGYTHLFQQGTLEFSALAAVDIYTKNDATDYQNGSVFRLDAMLTKHLANGWAIGLVGGWLEQIDDDSGPAADRLGGFKGHSLGLGPSISYTHHISKTSSLSFAFRYVAAFDVEKQLDGNPAVFTISYTP
ncbi:MAG: SphA family protein [Rhodanobacteraceae bacterium]